MAVFLKLWRWGVTSSRADKIVELSLRNIDYPESLNYVSKE